MSDVSEDELAEFVAMLLTLADDNDSCGSDEDDDLRVNLQKSFILGVLLSEKIPVQDDQQASHHFVLNSLDKEKQKYKQGFEKLLLDLKRELAEESLSLETSQANYTSSSDRRLAENPLSSNTSADRSKNYKSSLRRKLAEDPLLSEACVASLENYKLSAKRRFAEDPLLSEACATSAENYMSSAQRRYAEDPLLSEACAVSLENYKSSADRRLAENPLLSETSKATEGSLETNVPKKLTMKASSSSRKANECHTEGTESLRNALAHLCLTDKTDSIFSPNVQTLLNFFAKHSLEIKSMEKIKNDIFLDRYTKEKDHLKSSRRKDFKLREEYLFHGPGVSWNKDESLDQRLARRGYFGYGIYFSDDPRKCLNYSKSSGNKKSRRLLICRVILGDVKKYADGESDKKLKREPQKMTPTEGWKYYDSIQGRPKDYNEFVIYDGRRAITDFIVEVEQMNPTEGGLANESLRKKSAPCEIPRKISFNAKCSDEKSSSDVADFEGRSSNSDSSDSSDVEGLDRGSPDDEGLDGSESSEIDESEV